MATEPVLFEHASVRSFRNLQSIDFDPGPRLNVIFGDNGQGKTSVLEALYFVATSKSFRTERLRELVTQGETVASVRSAILEGSVNRIQRAAISRGKRSLQIDGKKPANLSEYAVRTPVVVFHPKDIELVSGPETQRRRLLDRVALFLDPPAAPARSRYAVALKERQRLLEERGLNAPELSAYEAIVAEQGARLALGRRRAAHALSEELPRAFEQMAPERLTFGFDYVPGGTESSAEFRTELARRRSQDLRRRKATFGPHRDELRFHMDSRPARQHASQGQQRLLTLAIKVAELFCVQMARGTNPVLLLDDVSSELDHGRTGAVHRFLQSSESQVFVTTTRPELFADAKTSDLARRDFRLERGRIVV